MGTIWSVLRLSVIAFWWPCPCDDDSPLVRVWPAGDCELYWIFAPVVQTGFQIDWSAYICESSAELHATFRCPSLSRHAALCLGPKELDLFPPLKSQNFLRKSGNLQREMRRGIPDE
jgi:hypothetical protein